MHPITYTYTASNGCDGSAEQTLLVDECTQIKELHEKGLQIFPNPTTGEFEISLECYGSVSIELFTMLGIKVARYDFFSNGSVTRLVNLGNYESGIYFISVNTENETRVKKIKLVKH